MQFQLGEYDYGKTFHFIYTLFGSILFLGVTGFYFYLIEVVQNVVIFFVQHNS